MNRTTILSKPSLIFLIFSVCFSVCYMDLWRFWTRGETQNNRHTPLVWDVAQYYSYLPATFINHGSFDACGELAPYLIFAPDSTRIPKTTYGMSIPYSPFFALGYKIAVNEKAKRDGISQPFIDCLHWGSIFYGLLGLFLLRIFLLYYFSEWATAITLAIVFLGTNLFSYVLAYSEMTHGYLFMLVSALLLTIRRWYIKPGWWITVLLAFLIALISLIRPTEIILSLLFVFWMVDSKQDLLDRIKFLFRQFKYLLIIPLMIVLIWIPQFIFWKHHTGSYFYFSYPGERFFFNDPQIINILFSYRKGWFVYTPLILLAFIGFFFMRGPIKKTRPVLVFLILGLIYLLSCWWDWHFGGGFGGRGFIQYYAFLAIPIASLTDYIIAEEPWFRFKSWLQAIFLVIIFCGIFINIGQAYQCNVSLLHYDSMTKKAYWHVFGRYKLSGADTKRYWDMLKPPNYEKMRKGERK